MIWDAVEAGDHKRVVALIGSGANVNALNSDGESPLHFAAMYGNVEITELLLSNGARIDIADREGNTPLHWAASAGRFQQVKLLVERGANVAAKNSQDLNAIERCGNSHERIKCFLAGFLRNHEQPNP